MTVTGDSTFSASKTFLQTNGCKLIAMSVHCFVFRNNGYSYNDKR